jgi:hypothetical protein
MPRDNRRPRRRLAPLLGSMLLVLSVAACATLRHETPPPPPPPPRGEPLPPSPPPSKQDDPGPVKVVQVPIVVAAWAEPRSLPAGGGQVQLLVRVQKKGGARLGGVEVRFSASTGSLYSDGQVLTTDAQGMTRDRLATRRTSIITLNAGGTRYRFQVNVGEPQ